MKQKLLLDENVPRSVLRLLRRRGFEVSSLSETAPGLSNSDVAWRSIQEGMIILTMDSDFLKFERSLQEKLRVILIQARGATAAKVSEIVDKNLIASLRLLDRSRVVILTKAGTQ